MADPVTLGVIITGLVGAYKAYTEYKAAVAKSEAEKTAPPAKSQEAAKGEQAAPIIKAAVQQHGTDKEQTTLNLFEGDPSTFRSALETVLKELAQKNAAFAGQLQTIAQQADIQTGGVHGEVKLSDNAKADVAVGVSSGTITYNAGSKEEQK